MAPAILVAMECQTQGDPFEMDSRLILSRHFRSANMCLVPNFNRHIRLVRQHEMCTERLDIAVLTFCAESSLMQSARKSVVSCKPDNIFDSRCDCSHTISRDLAEKRSWLLRRNFASSKASYYWSDPHSDEIQATKNHATFQKQTRQNMNNTIKLAERSRAIPLACL